MTSTQLSEKLFFKIGEVSSIVGVEPHVLRYWESEISALRPLKTRGAHRVYRRREVELAMLIRTWLHDDGLTMAGVRKRLRDQGKHLVTSAPDPDAQREVQARAELLGIRKLLSDLLVQLDAPACNPKPRDQTGAGSAMVTHASEVPEFRSRLRGKP